MYNFEDSLIILNFYITVTVQCKDYINQYHTSIMVYIVLFLWIAYRETIGKLYDLWGSIISAL